MQFKTSSVFSPPCTQSWLNWRQKLNTSFCKGATHCNTQQHTATLCNTLQHSIDVGNWATRFVKVQHTATHCNTQQHTATHCNTLQHSIDVRNWATRFVKVQHTATYCNTLQHTAAHCNTLQHPATLNWRQKLSSSFCTGYWVTQLTSEIEQLVL